MAKFDIAWDAPEFEYREKTVSWYWISIIVAAVIIGFAVYIKNFLFGFFIVVAEVLLIVWGNREPKAIAFRLTDEHLAIGENKFYAMKELESWSVSEGGDGFVELMFYFRARFKAPLIVIAPAEKLQAVRENLKPLLKEVEHDPSVIDSIEKILHF